MDLVPELKLIIGEQPPVAALPPQEARIRSHLAFRRFLGVFARSERPLARFLDDLQWLDSATIDFLEVICWSSETWRTCWWSALIETMRSTRRTR